MAIDNKYDRQLRLWGSAGQKALSESTVLLLGATLTGCETLKNLVLPGLGRFIVLDDAKTQSSDAAHNWFTPDEELGVPRAAAATKWLQELNPDCQGTAIVQSPSAGLAGPELDLSSVSLIVLGLPGIQLAASVSHLAAEAGIPVIWAVTYGFIGRVRLQASQHCIWDRRPDGAEALTDMRLHAPWPELQAAADEIDLASLDDMQHAHVPWPLILLQARRAWLAEHGSMPASFAARKAFKAAIAAMARRPDEENFAEAVKEAHRACAGPDLSETGAAIQQVGERSGSAFGLLASALGRFRDMCQGLLPLTGHLPDMTATTVAYVALQNVYATQAAKELGAYTALVREQEAAAGMPAGTISGSDIARMVKSAQFMGCVSLRAFSAEFLKPLPDPDSSLLEDAAAAPTAEHTAPLKWWLALRAAERVHESTASWPGAADDSLLEQHAAAVLAAGQAELTAAGLPGTHTWRDAEFQAHTVPLFSAAHAEEVTRYAGVELPSVAAIVGGVASQEAIKLLTGLYEPVDNTWIYNGVASVAGTLQA